MTFRDIVPTKIVRDGAGNLYRVTENPRTPQAYFGFPVVAVKGGYVVKAMAHRGTAARLIRKLGTVVVEG